MSDYKTLVFQLKTDLEQKASLEEALKNTVITLFQTLKLKESASLAECSISAISRYRDGNRHITDEVIKKIIHNMEKQI